MRFFVYFPEVFFSAFWAIWCPKVSKSEVLGSILVPFWGKICVMLCIGFLCLCVYVWLRLVEGERETEREIGKEREREMERYRERERKGKGKGRGKGKEGELGAQAWSRLRRKAQPKTTGDARHRF